MSQKKTYMTHRSVCRICGSRKLTRVLSLGQTPLANAFVPKEKVHEPELFFPLDLYLCAQCSLVQLLDIVEPEILFKDYLYASSTSPVFRAHFERFASDMQKRFSLTSRSLVIDIGSNDGILLAPFKKLGMRVLGVDPAETVAADARKKGIPTEIAFFNAKFAARAAKKYGKAELITATNVFAHIDDIHDIARGVKSLLTSTGTFIVEAPYIGIFLKDNLFDTVYHEHLSYYSVTALNAFFRSESMHITDVELVPTHGGSLRIYAKKGKAKKASTSLSKFLRNEKKMALQQKKTYDGFARRILKNRSDIQRLLIGLKLKGKTIAGYGAPAKGTTLLNYFSIGADVLDYIVDDSPYKQGRYTPGSHIPIVSSEMLTKKRPDYLFIIAWNFKDPIMKKNDTFRKAGGKFIIPVPHPTIV